MMVRSQHFNAGEADRRALAENQVQDSLDLLENLLPVLGLRLIKLYD